MKYYAILISGLITVSWMIWARFIRDRVIRNIPDDLFTELRFWILLYICYVYLYVIKNLIRSKEPNVFVKELAALFFIPLSTLDNFIKYKSFLKNYYKRVNIIFIDFLSDRTIVQVKILVIIFEIIPRVILVIFLLLDTFYFKKLELFYKVVFIGAFPFIFRYIYYSLEDLKTYFTTLLENKYSYVEIFEKGYEWEVTREREDGSETKAQHHYERVSIEEYIKIIIENTRKNNHIENFPYEYVGFPFPKEEIYVLYRKEKYNSDNIKFESKDYNRMDKLFHYLIPYIIKIRFSWEVIYTIKHSSYMKVSKIIIFGFYLVCWSYIVVTSYIHYPVNFNMFFYLIENIKLYLALIDDPFSMDRGFSQNKNLFTIENVKFLFKTIFQNKHGKSS